MSSFVAASPMKTMKAVAPLRLTFGGGGTDFPAYADRFGGFAVTAAINRHVEVALYQPSQDPSSDGTDASEPFRRALIEEIEPNCDDITIRVSSDLPFGTGLGASSAMLVAGCLALSSWRERSLDCLSLAHLAFGIESARLGRKVGMQDHVSASFGGMLAMRFNTSTAVSVEPLVLSEWTMERLVSGLALIYTGRTRNCSAILLRQHRRLLLQDDQMVRQLHEIKEIGLESRAALESGDLARFAVLMSRQWENKKKRDPLASTDEIERMYRLGMESGALGGKLVGAGGAGFLLFYTEDKAHLLSRLAQLGLTETKFAFSSQGAHAVLDH